MKSVKIGIIVLGIALFVFMVAPIASAQTAITDQWFKGKATIKGFDISGENIVGKAKGGGTVYAHIVAGVDEYTVTTCVEDFNVDDTWYTIDNTILASNIYGTIDDGEIWDFFASSDGLQANVGGADNFYFYPMFQVKYSKKAVSFKSFACGFYNNSEIPWQLGSCTMSLKSVDIENVPTGCKIF